jgi:hypothetical protein
MIVYLQNNNKGFYKSPYCFNINKELFFADIPKQPVGFICRAGGKI